MSNPKLYTRSELLKFIRMNKPKPNHPVADSYWCGLTKEQYDYIITLHPELTAVDSGTTHYRILINDNCDAIITHDGYILPYEPKEKPPFDLELEKHQYMKDQVDKVMAQYQPPPNFPQVKLHGSDSSDYWENQERKWKEGYINEEFPPVPNDPFSFEGEPKYFVSFGEGVFGRDDSNLIYKNSGNNKWTYNKRLTIEYRNMLKGMSSDWFSGKKFSIVIEHPLAPTTWSDSHTNRETFLNTLASTLTAAEINVSVGIAEKIYKLYNLVQVYGGGVTMDQINKIKSEL